MSPPLARTRILILGAAGRRFPASPGGAIRRPHAFLDRKIPPSGNLAAKA